MNAATQQIIGKYWLGLFPNQLFQDFQRQSRRNFAGVPRHPFRRTRKRIRPFVVPPSVSSQDTSRVLQAL